jgi:hypothetical protein
MDEQPFGCNYPKIVLSYSNDWGYNWSSPEVITNDEEAVEYAPCLISSLEHSDTLLHCFYAVYSPDHGYDLNYVRSLPFYSHTMEIPENQAAILSIGISPDATSSSATITYKNSEGNEAKIEIYNILGQRIWSKNVYGKEGSAIWDGKTNSGIKVSSGVYFVRMVNTASSSSIKLEHFN